MLTEGDTTTMQTEPGRYVLVPVRLWAEVVARRDQLRALQSSRKRVWETLLRCTVLVEERANMGDQLARFLKEDLDAAFAWLEAENVAAVSLLKDTDHV